MIFKTKLPVRKSKKDIEFYIKHGPTFGLILFNLKCRIQKGILKCPQEVIEYFILACNDEFKDYVRHFPFSTQTNINGIPFKEPVCISVNDVVAHGRTSKEFEPNDIISVDCGLALAEEKPESIIGFGGSSLLRSQINYLHFDSAFTVQISEKDDWITAPLKALENLIKEQPKDVYELGSIIENTCYEHKLSNIISLTGHGIGYSLHEPPYIHNARGNYLREEIFEGLCFCAEPIFAKRNNKNKLIERTCIDSDGWTILTQSGVPTSHFETMYCKHEGQIIDLLGMTKWLL